MMLFSDHLVVVRGGGDLATGVIYRLHQAGFPIIVLELALPLTIRRTVAVSSAVAARTFRVEGLHAVRAESVEQAVDVARTWQIPVLVSPTMPALPAAIVVDARMAKRNIDTTIDDARLVVGLGPGFSAGTDCHVVIETMRGHRLGRVIRDGGAAIDTGVPGLIGGEATSRVIRAARAGSLTWLSSIGDSVAAGERLGAIDGTAIVAPIGGVVRGLLAEGIVAPGLKIADIDPRADADACFEISDKSLAVGGGALEAVLAWLNT